MQKKKSLTSKYENTSYGHIGIRVSSDSLEATESVEGIPKYAEFEIKRLTKANSFLIVDEMFYIAKKSPDGKASRIHHVYRVDDKRYITPSPRTKEETIEYVKRKYIELDA